MRSLIVPHYTQCGSHSIFYHHLRLAGHALYEWIHLDSLELSSMARNRLEKYHARRHYLFSEKQRRQKHKQKEATSINLPSSNSPVPPVFTNLSSSPGSTEPHPAPASAEENKNLQIGRSFARITSRGRRLRQILCKIYNVKLWYRLP
ncbi:unnamed protein product [Clavelina lepadiformis]|uniref:Uncharacterized protein n=1 Tax=Clavelina lepadiformis TaxID=159417 RepID=A0ABP0FI29_CLALP